MSSVSLDDLGFKGYKFNKQVCVNIAQHGNFHIAAFLLPKGKLLPIHDHPKMAVCSKLIGGELKVRSFTTTSSEPLSPKAKTCIDVELSEDSIKTPADDAWVISSTKNNYHEFTALSDCVILDVLIPPYAYPERTCTYYSAEATSVPFHNAGEVKSASDKSRKVTGQVSYKSSNVHERPLYTLEVVPEEVVFRKYGLPVAVKYNGYVPSLPPN